MAHRKRIFVAGHKGMVGAAILRALQARGGTDLIVRSHAELDLTDQAAVRGFFRDERPEEVYLAAARVGGIHANNTYPADFIYQNLMIEANVVYEAWRTGVQRLLFLGSSCVYPKFAQQPTRESELLSGVLEPTNEPYAIAKIAGIKLCESCNRQYGTDYRSVMPTNLYGPGDNYDLENSHVIPAMIRKLYLARLSMSGDVAGIVADEKGHGPIPADIKVMLGLDPVAPLDAASVLKPQSRFTLWGTGKPRREFLYVDDMADASVHVMELERERYAAQTLPMQSHLNVGTGKDITIRELAELVARVVGYRGELLFDASKPDGTPRKLMDSSRLESVGWRPTVSLEDGLRRAFDDFVQAPVMRMVPARMVAAH